jgi:hypothetical protein
MFSIAMHGFLSAILVGLYSAARSRPCTTHICFTASKSVVQIGNRYFPRSYLSCQPSIFLLGLGMQISASLAAVLAAVCATIGVLFGTVVTVLYNHRLDKNKRRRDERDTVNRFRDVLLRSSEQLQSHVLQLCHGHVPLRVHHLSLSSPDSYAYCILIFRIGQLLCWIFLLENDIQTIYYTPTAVDHRIMNVLYAIHRGLGDPLLVDGQETPLRIFRGLQDSIGELMTIGDSEKGTQRCMGYPEFWKQWTVVEDNQFRPWFSQLEEGLKRLSDARSGESQLQGKWFFRVMQFQHLLIELVDALDPRNDRVYTRPRPPCARIKTPFLVELCMCTDCMVTNLSVHFGSLTPI